jgi:hypothetical protein
MFHIILLSKFQIYFPIRESEQHKGVISGTKRHSGGVAVRDVFYGHLVYPAPIITDAPTLNVLELREFVETRERIQAETERRRAARKSGGV